MLHHMKDNIIPLFEERPTAKEIMDALETKYGCRSDTQIQLLLDKFNNIKMNEGDAIGDHVNQLKLIAKELADAGHTLSDKMQVTIVLNSLPSSWDHVVTSLTHLGNKLAMTTLPILLMLEEDRMKRRKRDNASSRLMMAQSSHATQFKLKYKFKHKRFKKQWTRKSRQENKPRDACYRCGERGHYKINCPLNKRPKNKGKEIAMTISEALVIESPPTSWWVDSAATRHIARNRELFVDLKEKQLGEHRVYMGNNTYSDVLGEDRPITRSRAKKIKEAMQGLVQSTWDEASKSPTLKIGIPFLRVHIIWYQSKVSNQHITISHRSDSSLKGMADNSSFVLLAMQQQFEWLNFVWSEVRDRMDHQEAAIRNLQGGRDRRRCEPRVENEYENEGDGEDEEDLASEVGSGRHRRVRHERGLEGNLGGRDGVDRDLGSIKMKISSFQGKTDPEFERLNFVWSEVRDRMDLQKAAIRNLQGGKDRRRREPRVENEYENEKMRSRSVEDYHKEMEVAMIRANVEEDREATMTRFLSGLNRDIANVIELIFDSMVMWRQLKRKGTARYTSVSSTTWKSKWDRNDPAVKAKRKTELPKGKDEGTSNKPKVKSQLSRNKDIKCFKCLGSGHIASQCPNRRVMIMRDNEEVMPESEDDSDEVPELADTSDDDGVVYPVIGESLVARRALNTHIKVDDVEQQRERFPY
uniref:CCHC-type domain-containing protein n=1 Tax=Fagus sylvatica TaxID=28930 RepID=A0A2N9F1D3_FAGSY